MIHTTESSIFFYFSWTTHRNHTTLP